MSIAHARAAYRQTEVASPAATSPYDIVFQTLKELARALNVLAEAHARSAPLPSDHMNRGLTAIYILQSSLDFEQGGEIAEDLFGLYEFARFHLLRAWRSEPDPRLREAADAISEILSAWQEIGSDVGQSSA
jgi:flagellar secretion chaperone FliS